MRDKVKFRLRFVPLNKTSSYTCTILFICTTFVHNPTKWDFTRRRRISPCVARFHLPTGKSHCAYFFVRARGGRSGKGVAGVSDKPCRRKWLRTCHLYYVTPKLVCRKSASRRTTVSKLYRWRQFCRSQSARRVKKITNSQSALLRVSRCCHTATSERGCGWVGYLPQTIMPEVKRASTRSQWDNTFTSPVYTD